MFVAFSLLSGSSTHQSLAKSVQLREHRGQWKERRSRLRLWRWQKVSLHSWEPRDGLGRRERALRWTLGCKFHGKYRWRWELRRRDKYLQEWWVEMSCDDGNDDEHAMETANLEVPVLPVVALQTHFLACRLASCCASPAGCETRPQDVEHDDEG